MLSPLLVLACLTPAQESAHVPGLTLRLFELEWNVETLPDLVPDQTPNVDRLVVALDLEGGAFGSMQAPFMTRALGWLLVEEPGEYQLRLTSDDGSRLFLDGELRVNNDGQHGPRPMDSEPLQLVAGEHSLLIEHFDSGGGRALKLEWRRPGSDTFSLVPGDSLRAENDLTRVTSPGPKAIVSDKSPGNGLPVPGVHPGWRVESIRPEGLEPKIGSMALLPDGRLAFGTFDPLQRDERNLPDIESKEPDSIWALDVETGEVEEIITGVFEPTGMCVVDGSLYVAQRRSVDRFRDTDGDGVYEERVTIGEGWQGWNYHQFTFGLVHKDGKLYTALSTTMAPPGWEGMETNSGPNDPLRGSVLEIDIESGEVVAFAGGVRTPNGLGLGPEGELLYSDNQGAWMPTSILGHVEEGDFFGHHNWTRFVPKLAERFPIGGHPSVYCDRPRKLPAVWLPHGEVVNSPTEPLLIPYGVFKDQILLGELTGGGIRRVDLYRRGGVLQGTLFRFTQGLESGVNRMEWGTDGSLYVGGIGANGNWNWRGTQFGLQRLVPTKTSVFELLSVRQESDGFMVRFTEPAEIEGLTDVERYSATSWTYAPTFEYGGPKVGERELKIERVEADRDGRWVKLFVDDVTDGSCVHLTLDVLSYVDGLPLWSGEAWATVRSTSAAPSELDRALDVRGDLVRIGDGSGKLVNVVPEVRSGEMPAPDLSTGEAFEFLHLPSTGGITVAWHSSGGGKALPIVSRGHGTAVVMSPDDGPAESGVLRIALSAVAYGLGRPEPHVPTRLSFLTQADSRVVVDSAVLQVMRKVQPPTGGFEYFRLMPDLAPGAWRRPLDSGDWSIRGGGGSFDLDDGGVLSGRSLAGSASTYFVSSERFQDFEMTFDVRCEAGLNGGVQIRTEFESASEVEVAPRAHQPTGLQVEIDTSTRAWSGGLFEANGRGWLHPLHRKPYARRAWRQGDWNHFRVLCEDDRIRTWVNGVPAADHFDSVRIEGRIAFQVHGPDGSDESRTIEWRNVRIRELTR